MAKPRIIPDSPLKIELWDINRPKDYPKNARKWSDKAVAKVAASIREYGFRQPWQNLTGRKAVLDGRPQ